MLDIGISLVQFYTLAAIFPNKLLLTISVFLLLCYIQHT